MEIKKCENCGTANEVTSKFCIKCGTRFEEKAEKAEEVIQEQEKPEEEPAAVKADASEAGENETNGAAEEAAEAKEDDAPAVDDAEPASEQDLKEEPASAETKPEVTRPIAKTIIDTPADQESRCPHCGESVDPAAKFCMNCGQQLNASATGTAQHPYVQPTYPGATAPIYNTYPSPGTQSQPPKRKRKGLSMKGAMGLCAATCAVVLGLGFTIFYTVDNMNRATAQAEEQQQAQKQAEEAKAAQEEAERQAAEAKAAQEEAERKAKEEEEARLQAEAEKKAAEAAAAAKSNSGSSSSSSGSGSSASGSSSSKASEYILPYSNSRYYTTSELSDLSTYQLYLARNEIVARRGRTFMEDDLSSYFNSKSWYHGTIDRKEFDAVEYEDRLNSYEFQNMLTILDLERSRNSPYLD